MILPLTEVIFFSINWQSQKFSSESRIENQQPQKFSFESRIETLFFTDKAGNERITHSTSNDLSA